MMNILATKNNISDNKRDNDDKGDTVYHTKC